MKPYRFLLLMLVAAFVLLSSKSFSQPPPPPPPVDTNPTDAPLDGGLTLLLAAGAAYGIKRAKGDRKKNPTNSDE